MRRYENRPQSRRGDGPRSGFHSRGQSRPFAETPPKATAAEPWVFVLGEERQNGRPSLEALISEKVVGVPLQKRSLLILPAGCPCEGRWDNLCGLGEEPRPEDVERIKDPAFSIAAPAKRIIGHIEQNELEMGMFGRIVVFDLGLDQEKRSAFIDDANLILGKASNKTIEALFFTDSKNLPPNYPASAIIKPWPGPAERAASARQSAPAERERPEADRKKERQMLTQTEGKLDLEEMGSRIKKTLEETLAYSRPEELEEITKLIRKNIPLGRRTYLAAYLLLKSSQEKPAPARTAAGRPLSRRAVSEGPVERRGDRFERSGDRFERSGDRFERPEDRAARKPERKPANGVNFYINVGFHDHMNPKTLAAFIAGNCGIKPEDVCDINLKPTFAFFTVRAELAGGISEGLTGKTVGKKTVKANPADQKPPRQPRPRQSAPSSRPVEAPAAEPQQSQPPQPQPQQQAQQPQPEQAAALEKPAAAEPLAAAAAEIQAPAAQEPQIPAAEPQTPAAEQPAPAPEQQSPDAEPRTEAQDRPETGTEQD